MTEATFAKLRTSAAFDVVGSVGGPQTGSIRLVTLITDAYGDSCAITRCMSGVGTVSQS